MLNKETDFEYAAQYFLSATGRVEDKFSLLQPSLASPGTRILVIDSEPTQRFVVKVYREPFPMDKNSPHLQNEIAAQNLLRGLGIASREYLLVDLDGNNPIGVPISVATFIGGETLENLKPEEISYMVPKVLDCLFEIHSRTINHNYGYLPGIQINRKGSTFAQFEAVYLRSDIRRDNIPFSPEELIALEETIDSLNCTDRFCLCHCDVTLRNSLWDGSNIKLIDWAYCHYSEPGFDIANVIFWLAECGLIDQIEYELLRSEERYQVLGFDISPSFLFYLSQRYIEYGRIKGSFYIEQGKRLLGARKADDIRGVIEKLNVFKEPI